MKRVLAVLLAMVMLCGIMPLMASAAIDDWVYIIDNGRVFITGYTGTEIELVVPDEIGGYPVTAIADNALGSRANLTIVHLPLTITRDTAKIFGNHNPALRVCSETNDSYTSSLAPYISYITADWQQPPPQRKITSANGVGANGLTICLCDGINHGVDLLTSAPFWSTWPPVLQWILEYVFFGWLWMRWF